MTKEQHSIRRVPLSRRDRGEEAREDVLYEREELHIEEPPASSWRRIFLWSITFLFLILLGFAVSTSFTGARVKVSPKTKTVMLNHEFTAETAEGAAIHFVALPIDETAEITLPADTVEKVSEKATGTIVIYNNFSEKPQRLIKNTRFETPNGLMYRIGSSITVPGKTEKSGKKLSGSIEASVTADAPGAEYNILLSDFTIPGFKSDPARFAAFYARSKTPMTGGFDGTVKVPSETALRAARASLRDALTEKVAKKDFLTPPRGHVFFRAAIQTKQESLPVKRSDGSVALVKERLTGAAYAFDRTAVLREIAKTAASEAGALPIDIPHLEDLVFEFKEPPGSDALGAKTIRFMLKGEVQVVWKYDEEKLRLALAGKEKDELAAVLSDFPAVEKADFIIRPFWSRSFPENPKKISIENSSVSER